MAYQNPERNRLLTGAKDRSYSKYDRCDQTLVSTYSFIDMTRSLTDVTWVGIASAAVVMMIGKTRVHPIYWLVLLSIIAFLDLIISGAQSGIISKLKKLKRRVTAKMRYFNFITVIRTLVTLILLSYTAYLYTYFYHDQSLIDRVYSYDSNSYPQMNIRFLLALYIASGIIHGLLFAGEAGARPTFTLP